MSLLVIGFWIVCLTVVVVQLLRFRSHGPRVTWIPKRWRPRVNDYYKRRGWPEPYDADGNKRSWWRS